MRTKKYYFSCHFIYCFVDKPKLSKEFSSSIVSSWNGKQMTLNCTVSDGLPTPNFTWYNPNGDQISTGVLVVPKRSQVVIITKQSTDYGSYKCKATNIAGSVEHLINVTQLCTYSKSGRSNRVDSSIHENLINVARFCSYGFLRLEICVK